jgi:hypothetical protein
MTNLLKPTVLTLMLAAHGCNYVVGNPSWGNQPPKPGHPAPAQAPEVDPSLAFGGFTLLAGTLMVMRSRRSR